MADETYRDKGAYQADNTATVSSTLTYVDKGAQNAISVAAGGATGKSNPLHGCLGGCLSGVLS